MARYKIFSGDELINEIVSDEEFCEAWCEKHDYTYELQPEPALTEPDFTTEERVAALEETTAQQGEILQILLSGETGVDV